MSPMQLPTVGRTVHYVSRGSLDLLFEPACRAAIVTEVPPEVEDFPHAVSLCVLNPTGMFFDQAVPYDASGAGGTWHWAERV